MRVLAAIHDLMFSSKVRATSPSVHFVPRNVDVAAHVLQERPDLLLLDLGARTFDALDVLAKLSGSGVRIVAYVDHVQEDLIEKARAAGATTVMSKGEFARKLPQLVT